METQCFCLCVNRIFFLQFRPFTAVKLSEVRLDGPLTGRLLNVKLVVLTHKLILSFVFFSLGTVRWSLQERQPLKSHHHRHHQLHPASPNSALLLILSTFDLHFCVIFFVLLLSSAFISSILQIHHFIYFFSPPPLLHPFFFSPFCLFPLLCVSSGRFSNALPLLSVAICH